MKLLARIHILYKIKPTPRRHNTVLSWEWHVLHKCTYLTHYDNEHTTVSLAISRHRYDIMLYLLEQGADPRCGWAPDRFGAYRALLLRLIRQEHDDVHIAIDTILIRYNCIDDLKPFNILSTMISPNTTLKTLKVLVSHGLRFYPVIIHSMLRASLTYGFNENIQYACDMKCENFAMQNGYNELHEYLRYCYAMTLFYDADDSLGTVTNVKTIREKCN